MWCSHSDCTGMSWTSTSSSYPSSFGNVVISNSGGVSISANARAIRPGVAAVDSAVEVDAERGQQVARRRPRAARRSAAWSADARRRTLK